MYQRYYKQKKFGRFFGFFIVIGSGVYHFAKLNINIIRKQFSLKNLIKFENYLPEQTKIMTNSIQQYLRITNQVDTNTSSMTNLEMESKFHIYSKNLDQLKSIENINLLTKSAPNLNRPNFDRETFDKGRFESTILGNKKINKEDWVEYEKMKENIYYYQKIRKKVNEIRRPKH